jgi:catechol 2,3-dioxygenase-like lactoylglutathione lyase family enzyme
MKLAISNLLKSYEDRKMSRRQLVEGLALMAAAAETASAAAGFQGASIHHLSIQVTNLQKSADFYAKTFNCTVTKRDGTSRVELGKQGIVLREAKPAGRVDHIAIGVANFNKDAVTADLKARGAMPKEAKGAGFHVIDPDGLPIQISGIQA